MSLGLRLLSPGCDESDCDVKVRYLEPGKFAVSHGKTKTVLKTTVMDARTALEAWLRETHALS